MTHIGIDARITYYTQAGIARYTHAILDALAALDQSTQYSVLHSRKHTDSLLPGPNFRRVNLWTPSHNRLEKWALSAEIIRLGLDVLHTTDFIPPLWGAKRFVITVHDLNFLHYPQFLTADSRRYYNNQITRAVQQADHILSVSEATRQDLIDMLDVPADKITVHPEGVEAAFQPLPENTVNQTLHDLGLTAGYILFVGTLEPRKNIPGLLEAYHKLRGELPDAPPLVLAGRRGWLYDEIFARIDDLKLGEHVIWLEGPPQSVMPALYNGAYMLVTPSFYEGFGLPALEAMYCGTPAVVANRSSLPEVVGEAGILVDPDEPDDIAAGISRLLTDSALYDRLCQASLQQAKHFTWQQSAAVIWDVYQHVVG
jgi:glycosyltransferase involved in cell wall biosynthesis